MTNSYSVINDKQNKTSLEYHSLDWTKLEFKKMLLLPQTLTDNTLVKEDQGNSTAQNSKQYLNSVRVFIIYIYIYIYIYKHTLNNSWYEIERIFLYLIIVFRYLI